MKIERPGILIVDDDVDICKLLPALLQSEGDNYHVTAAHSFKGAQLLLGTRRFDLFITEYFIPNDQTMSEFCHSIKLVSPNSPFIVYSKFDEKMAKEDALGAGADLYLVKPHDEDKICSSVRDLLVESKERIATSPHIATKRKTTSII